MQIIKNIALLASDTARTKAYIQVLLKNSIVPEECLVFSDDVDKMKIESEEYEDIAEKQRYFSVNEPVLYTLKKYGIDYSLVNNKDINSETMISAIKRLNSRYLIYSGYGGFILKKPLFELGKEYIHVHAGILPQYRGSTTVYYSYLQEKRFGATAIFLNEGIDEGKIILQRNYDVSDEDINIDYIYEPFMRASVLVDVVKEYFMTGEIKTRVQNAKKSETYYIIHPVLKHIALLGIDNDRRKVY